MPVARSRQGGDRPAASLTWSDVKAWRLRRHRLDQRAPRDTQFDIVDDICLLHAQLMASASAASTETSQSVDLTVAATEELSSSIEEIGQQAARGIKSSGVQSLGTAWGARRSRGLPI